MDNVFSLKGRKAVVTGGSRGIGASIVELFARYGAEIAFCHSRDGDKADALVKKLSAEGFKVHGFECDIASEAEVSAMADNAKRALGNVDILVNCAGIGGDTPFTELTVAEWDRMISVHLRGTFLVTHAFFGGMLERNYGRVINFSSQMAYKGCPGMTHYSAAKAGILGFTRALSYEGAPRRVTVNAVAPGPINTELTVSLSEEFKVMKHAQLPLGRFGEVDEVAPTVLMLASDAGSYYTGQCLSPNGGDVML